MNVVTLAALPIAVLGRAAGATLGAWRAITAEQLALAELLAMAALAQVLVRATQQSAVLMEAINAQLGAFALLLTVVVADRAADRGASRVLAYGTAVVVAAATGAAAQAVHMQLVWNAFDASELLGVLIQENPRFVETRIVGIGLEWLIIDGLAAYVYADRREVRRIAARLHRAQLQRTAQAKRLVESQLQAMQARVEPAFLFDTLAHVRRLFDEDRTRAEQMLDDLIAYLRAAMPRMRDTSSTVKQEVELARAYLDILKVRLGDRLSVVIAVPEDIGDARLPPMLLLPLIDQAIGDVAETASSGDGLRIAIDTKRGKICLTLTGGTRAFSGPAARDAMSGLRERLSTLYGADARLDIRPRSDRSTEAVVEIPHETVEGGDR